MVKEEEPFHCIRCGKPFGTKSTVERIVAKLEGRHWMFAGENAGRLDVVRMCDDCRVDAVMTDSLDPMPVRSARRPAPPRTISASAMPFATKAGRLGSLRARWPFPGSASGRRGSSALPIFCSGIRVPGV